MKKFLKDHKRETVIFLICFTAKILAFLIVLGLCLKFGDWEFVNKIAEPADKIFSGGIPTFNFHEPGDWHPPLYYFFTALILKVFPYEWIIFLIQSFLVSISAVLVYKTGLIIFSFRNFELRNYIGGVSFWNHCERDGASTRNFSAEKYPCSKNLAPEREFRNSKFLKTNNGEKIAFWSAALFGIEPYLSFETNTLGSDVLGLFFFTFFVYFFIKYLVNYEMPFRGHPQAKKLGVFCYNFFLTKNFFAEDERTSRWKRESVPRKWLFRNLKLSEIENIKNLIVSSVFLGLATLTRPSTLFMPLVIFFFFIIFWAFTHKPALPILKHFLIFTAVFLLFIVPWMAVNKAFYGEFVFSRLSKVNFYPYNAATFIAAKEKISFGEARTRLEEKARLETEKTGESLDNYYSREAKKIIFSDPVFYAKLHLIKSVPFLIQPGYEIMLHGYGVPYKPDRPDLTLLFMQRNFSAILKFITSIDIATALYLAGLLFWGILNILLIAAFIKSFKQDKMVFLIFLFFIFTIVYHALLYGTIAIARYRLPLYFMFFMPAFYVIFTRKKLSAEN